MVQESRKLMKKILTEIKMIDNILYRNLWMKNILEDKVTAFLYYLMIISVFLTVAIVFLPSDDYFAKVILYALIALYFISLPFAMRDSGRKLKEIEKYNKNLRCWRRYWIKERNALLRDDPSLSDVKPGLSGRLIWDIIRPHVIPFLWLFMLVAQTMRTAYGFFCLITGSIGVILLFALYMGLDRPYEGKPCIEDRMR